VSEIAFSSKVRGESGSPMVGVSEAVLSSSVWMFEDIVLRHLGRNSIGGAMQLPVTRRPHYSASLVIVDSISISMSCVFLHTAVVVAVAVGGAVCGAVGGGGQRSAVAVCGAVGGGGQRSALLSQCGSGSGRGLLSAVAVGGSGCGAVGGGGSGSGMTASARRADGRPRSLMSHPSLMDATRDRCGHVEVRSRPNKKRGRGGLLGTRILSGVGFLEVAEVVGVAVTADAVVLADLVASGVAAAVGAGDSRGVGGATRRLVPAAVGAGVAAAVTGVELVASAAAEHRFVVDVAAALRAFISVGAVRGRVDVRRHRVATAGPQFGAAVRGDCPSIGSDGTGVVLLSLLDCRWSTTQTPHRILLGHHQRLPSRHSTSLSRLPGYFLRCWRSPHYLTSSCFPSCFTILPHFSFDRCCLDCPDDLSAGLTPHSFLRFLGPPHSAWAVDYSVRPRRIVSTIR